MTAPSDHGALQAGIEAILFLADEPQSAALLAGVLEVSEQTVEAAVDALAGRYTAEQRGIEIRRAAGGWRLCTAPVARPAVERWAVAGRTGRLTQAALETLAVIAYKQPIGRQAIGDIRGVNADAAVRSLVARGLVAEVGRHDGPGQAVLYGTTTTFLERLGLDSLEDLPPLTVYLPDAPAPDEPEFGALREVRRRLAKGGELSSRSPVGDRDGSDDDAEEVLLPPPSPDRTRGDAGESIDELTDELDRVARGAVDRLRRVRAESETAEEDADAAEGEAERQDEPAERAASDQGEPEGDAVPAPDVAASEVSDPTGGERG